MTRLKILGTLVIIAACLAHAPSRAASADLATADTLVRVQATEGRLALISLQCRRSGREWALGDSTPPIPLIASAHVNGQERPLAWKLARVRRNGKKQAVFTFHCQKPALELRSGWKAAPGPGPVEHTLEITNHSNQTLLLPLQTSLRFDVRAPVGHPLTHWWVEKGGSFPSDSGAHHEPIASGYQSSLLSTPYGGDGADRDAIPWTAVQDEMAREGWYVGIEFSGRVSLSLNRLPSSAKAGTEVETELGLDNAEPAQTRLLPGETWQAPAVFVGCYSGDVDDGSNRLHRWVESELRPPVHDPHYPLLTLNSWGSGMAVDEPLARRMIADAVSLGLEMFHIDAGWFRAVGDWRSIPAKFPHGLAEISDIAHANGLKFGLWVGWTQGGVEPDAEDRGAILNVFAPDRRDWFTHDYPPDWKPSDFTGANLCLADTAADDWCLSLLDRLVSEFHLDMLEHDQPMIVDSCARTDHPHTDSPADIAYRAARGYYRVYDALRAKHPRLLFEDCVNGGHTVDYGIARQVDYISITDTYSPLANRRAFYDASRALPPSMCECYVQNEPVKTPTEFRAMLRSGMMGWFTLMCDPNQWTAEQHSIARRQFSLYKTRLRPLIRGGNLYHLTERPDGVRWDAVQYADTSGRQAALMAFRGTGPEESRLFRLRGLQPETRYRVSFEDGAVPSVIRSGRDLMQEGIAVELLESGSSQLAFITAAGSKAGAKDPTAAHRRTSG